MRPVRRAIVGAAVLCACAAAQAARAAEPERVLHGGQEGTAFKSLTVEGEDRVHFDFARPELDPQLDPEQAPGLDWGSAEDVLDRTRLDGTSPFVTQSASAAAPYLGRPWLQQLASGAVARFRPETQNVERWKLWIADSHGETVASFEGKGQPPRDIAWDGRTKKGAPVQPGLTYSYVLEAFDRAGNKRNFVGPGFEIPAYRLQTPEGPVLAFAARGVSAARRSGSVSPLLLEASSWMNQFPRRDSVVRITATARSSDQANGLAGETARALQSLLLGDPASVQAVAAVQPDAPESGAVHIAPARR